MKTEIKIQSFDDASEEFWNSIDKANIEAVLGTNEVEPISFLQSKLEVAKSQNKALRNELILTKNQLKELQDKINKN